MSRIYFFIFGLLHRWKLRDRKEPIFLVQLYQLDFDKYDGELDYKL